MLSPKKFFQELTQNFQAWVFYTRYFRSLAKDVAGDYYNNNRYAIKRYIRERVTSVNQGFDLACQSQLFSSDVARLAENSRRMESRGKCSQVKPRVRVGLNWTDEKLEEEIGYAIDLGKDQVMV